MSADDPTAPVQDRSPEQSGEQSGGIGQIEFIALMATLVAMVALSVDGMLPALPRIAAELTPEAPNAAQMVITSFLFGMGVGTLFSGPLSDRFGRRPVIFGGVVLFVAGALAATQAQSLGVLIAARFVQGLGAAGPRIVVMAVVRDRHAGRGMARVLSFIMMVFSLVPAMAPLMGAAILLVADWHAIFLAFALFGMGGAAWMALRLPETLPPKARRPFRLTMVRDAIAEMLRHPVVRLSIVVQGFCFAILFSAISNIHPIYEQSLHRAESFPLWFALTAVLAASSSYLNALLVVRLGMRRMVRSVLLVQVAVSGLLVCALVSGLSGLALFVSFLVWQQVLFFQAGMTLGNLNAIAMEPMGHIAGLAASVIGALATVMSVILAIPVGLMFNGTPVPLVAAVTVFAAAALLVMQRIQRIDATG